MATNDAKSTRRALYIDDRIVEVTLVYSTRRKRTSSAKIVNGEIQIALPAAITADDEEEHIYALTRKLAPIASLADGNAALEARARVLAGEYNNGIQPHSVVWSDRQNFRWGSCTIETKKIRISYLVKSMPPWVQDAVIIHELAHLQVPHHNKAFYEIVNAYKAAHDAEIYLQGYGAGMSRSSRTTHPPVLP